MYLAAYEKIKIIVKTKIMGTDSGVGMSTKEWYYFQISNLSSHGISVCTLCMSILSRHNSGNISLLDAHLKYMSICFDYTNIISHHQVN